MRRLAFAFTGLALAATGGCQVLRDLAQELDRPRAEVTGVSFRDVSAEALTLAFDVAVDNPYPTALPLEVVDFELTTEGTSFLAGSVDPGGTVPAKGRSSIVVPAAIRYDAVMDLLGRVRPGSVVPYVARFDLGVDAPGVGPLTLPIEHAGELPIPAVPRISLADVRFDELSLERAAAQLDLAIQNPNDFGFTLAELGYSLSIGGRKVGGAKVEPGAKFAAGGEDRLTLPLSFSPRDLGQAAFDLLRGRAPEYRLEGAMELDTPFGPLRMPYEARR